MEDANNLVRLSDLVRVTQEAERYPDQHHLNFIRQDPICLRCLNESEVTICDTAPIHHMHREMRDRHYRGLWAFKGTVLIDVRRDEEKDRLRGRVKQLEAENTRLREQVYGPLA